MDLIGKFLIQFYDVRVVRARNGRQLTIFRIDCKIELPQRLLVDRLEMVFSERPFLS